MSIKAKNVFQAFAICLGLLLAYNASQVMGENCKTEPACAPVVAVADQQVAPVVSVAKAPHSHFSFLKRFFKRFEKKKTVAPACAPACAAVEQLATPEQNAAAPTVTKKAAAKVQADNKKVNAKKENKVAPKVKPVVPAAPAAPVAKPAAPAAPVVKPAAPAAPVVKPAAPAAPVVKPVAPAAPVVKPVAPAPAQKVEEPKKAPANLLPTLPAAKPATPNQLTLPAAKPAVKTLAPTNSPFPSLQPNPSK